ncbi:MAG: GNAT family N-acetyltransferase [Rhodothermales bacterium]
MKKTNITEREMTPDEFERMKTGFDENALDNGVAIQSADRYGFVATEGSTFLGCSSGLAYKNGDVYSGWFYLTDLFVEKAHRGGGLGAALLSALESKIAKLGVKDIWTWTAGYEAVGFYQKQGYSVILEMENWYADRSSRVALRKKLRA